LNVRLDIKLGSHQAKGLLESFNDENANKESVSDSINTSIINFLWDLHFSKIFVVMFMTRILPLIGIIFLVIDDYSERSLNFNLATSLIVFIYEICQIIQTREEYFKSKLNLLDFSGFLAGNVWILTYMLDGCVKREDTICLDSSIFIYIQMLWIFTICYRATDVFKLIPSTRKLFVILVVSF
jgi:hypothetical protein